MYACPILCCMEFIDCIPREIADRLRNVGNLREIRIRNHRPVRVNVGGQWYYVSVSGMTQQINRAIVMGDVCDDIVAKACNNSVYAYEKMLAQGFFTLSDGVRIGVCGSVMGSKEPVFQQYKSLCLRIPHYVNCVDNAMLDNCKRGSFAVIGPPCSGKTTFLRDFSVKISHSFNVLVADERGELFFGESLASNCDCDVLRWASKKYAFEVGIRAMSPQWLVCDELSVDDIDCVRTCADSGVNIACSVHGRDIDGFKRKFALEKYLVGVVLLSQIGNVPQYIALN